ncbi:ABC transporter substrate-binding protein [Rhodoligotrophos defluvii]|uniref:ABC transporter substrate-binding protein n=1 Tax=Rhodoligotrophos defluvii TaxID=2561934 RepID=UPI0010CA1DAD|nr:ABC transporter substrate-binding protein [Rhodoligotrophos defluvii]
MHTINLTAAAVVAATISAFGGALAQEGPLRIGVVTPISGTYAGIGQQIRWGLDLATKEINQAGGILGRQVELVYEDSEANPAVATQKAEKLIQSDKVEFLTGTVNSGATLSVGQLAERNGTLAATTVSYADSITGAQCSPNMFRVNASAHMQAATLAEWLAQRAKDARVLYVGPDYEMGRSSVAAFKAAAEAKGAQSAGEIFAPLGNNDYSQYFGQIRAARPDVIYTATAGNDTVRFLTQLDEFGLLEGLIVMGASGAVSGQNIKALGKAAEGFVTGIGYSPQIDTPENKTFVAAFEAMHGSKPDLFGTDSYGVLYFYKAAVEKAKTTETDAVRKAMEGLQWSTPQGMKTMRAGDHQAVQDMYIVQIKDGQFGIINKIAGSDVIGPDTCERF